MRGRRVKTRTLGDGTEVLETIYFDVDALCANEEHAAQLSKIVSPEADESFSLIRTYWGAATTIDDG